MSRTAALGAGLDWRGRRRRRATGWRVATGWPLACVLALGAGSAEASGYAGRRSTSGAWAQVVARAVVSSPEEGARGSAAGAADATVRCQAAALALGVRATGADGGERPRLCALSARWSRLPDTELLIGALRVHLGAGCLVGDEDWDELEPTQAFNARMLQAATTLSLARRARPGALVRVAAAGMRLSAWAAGPERSTSGTCASLARLGPTRLEGVAIGIRGLLLAAARTPPGTAHPWAWSASASLGRPGGASGGASGRSGGAAIVIELAGPLGASDLPRTDAWEVGGATWRSFLAGRVAMVGGRWRAGIHPLVGELDGAFRWGAGVSSRADGCAPDETAPSPSTARGWRLRWGLPGLAGVRPVLALLFRQSEGGQDGPTLLERSACLDLGAQPWSGLWLRAGFDAGNGERLRDAGGTGAATQIVRTVTGGLDLGARLALNEQLNCVLRYRQRDALQSLEGAAQPRLREIIDESERPTMDAEPADSYAEPAWLRERTGSALWFRVTWSDAGRVRTGLGLAAAPRTSSIPALVPTRLAPGGTCWRPLGAGAHLAEVWCGWGGHDWSVEACARWCGPAGEQRPEIALTLGASWRAHLARSADQH